MHKLLFLPILFVLLLLQRPIAQNDLGVHLIPAYYQAGITNPAQMPGKRLTFGLPGGYFNYFNVAGSVNDLLVDQEGKEVLDVNLLIDQASTNNRLQSGYDFSTLSFTYATDRWALSIHHAVRSHNFIQYPKTLPQLFWQGNAQFIGETVEFGPEQQSFAYSELGLGLTANYNKFSIGLRVKYLSGIGDVSSSSHQASIYTNPDIYQITLNTDYQFNTSAFNDDLLLVDSLEQITFGVGDNRLKVGNWFNGNPGYAFDLGIQYHPIPTLTLSAALENVGQIFWNKDIVNYTSQGSQEFAGFFIDDILNDPALSFTEARDSVLDLFAFEETSNSYKTDLPLGFRLGGQWQLNERWSFGGIYYLEQWRGGVYHAVALNAYAQVVKDLGVGVSYAIRNNRYDNIGLQLLLNLGPVRLMASTDNLPGLIQPFDARQVNGRLGFQVVL